MPPQRKRPNFLICLADDLGFSDLSPFGGEIHTPNIAALAQYGLRFTDFHATALCSPSRSMLLTGTDNHIAGLGTLVEWLSTPVGANPKGVKESQAPARGKLGYEGYLNERVVTVAEVLKDSGYATLMAGKWHLGLRKEVSPVARGFEKSFSLLTGASNHFGWEPELQEGTGEVPRMFSMNDPLHMEDGEYVSKLPEDWYSSTSYGDILLKYLKEWKEEEKEEGEGRPFFAYYPFTAPHWPLQVPPEFRERYRGMYDDGPDALRLKRLERLKELGLVDKDVEPHPVVAHEVPEWEQLSEEHRAKSARAMEVYAGMVECIDWNVGRVVDYLKEIDELDNTFVLFMSDNGAEGGAHEANPAFHGGPMAHLQKYYNNHIDNLGNHDSFIWYGPRWAQASTAPSRMYKSYTTEGGIRVPLIAKLPTSYTPSTTPNSITHTFSTIMDIAPTLLEMAGVPHPAPHYQNREIVGMRGKSMLPYLTGHSPSIHGDSFVEGWEMSGRAAIRKDNWKAVYLPSRLSGPSRAGADKWELFDLSVDPGEIHDLSTSQPEKLEALLKLWEQYVEETGVVPLNPALGRYLEATEEQMPDDGWMGYEFWKKGARVEGEREKFFKEARRFDGEGRRVVFREGVGFEKV